MEKASDWSFNKVLSIPSDDPVQFLNPVLEYVLELLESDTVEKVCQCLDDRIRISISKSLIPQYCVGLSKEPEVAGA
jgi:hypothetical protein